MTRSEIRVLAPEGMSRRRLLALLAAAGAVPLAGRFASAQAPQQFNLFTYPTFATEALIVAGRGQGLDVKTTIYSGADEMVAKLRGGGTRLYDMVVPLHTYVGVAADAGLIEPMDPAKLPNLAHVPKAFTSISDWSPNGKFYGVPFVWGANAVAYNYAETGEVDSLKALFEGKFKGRVAMRDDVEDAIAVGALYLGIKNPFDLDEKALQEVKKVLIQQKAMNRAYWRNIADLRSMFANGEVVLAWATLSVVAPLRKSSFDIRWIWPKEGALGWTEGIAAVKGGKNRAGVEAYANFTISTEYGEALVRETRYATTSSAALQRLSADMIGELGIQSDRMDSLLFKQLPANKARWLDIWTEVKAA
jgi:spermidine/putrescine transport system substrate-binding protein